MVHSSLRKAPLMTAALAALFSAACPEPPPKDQDANAEFQAERLNKNPSDILLFCQRNPVTCTRRFPDFVMSVRKQDAEDYKRLWKDPQAFCERYMSRRHSLEFIWPQDLQLYGLADCVEKGWGMQGIKDGPRNLVRWLSSDAKEDTPEALEAQKRLIRIYLNGIGEMPPDPQEAAQWMERAREKDAVSAEEMFQLAGLLEAQEKKSQRDQKDGAPKAGFRLWLERAAQAGHPEAQDRLKALEQAVGSEAKVQEPQEKAPEDGQRAAELALADKLLQGKEIPQDVPRGLAILEEHAQRGDLDAMAMLAGLYLPEEGTASPVPSDAKKGADWLAKAADQGHAGSMERLARSYEFGLSGKPKDSRLALDWYKRAASHGSFSAAMRVGRACDRGELGEGRSPEESVRWYGLALNACSDSKTKAACGLEQRGEIVSRLGAAWRRSKSGSANGSRWQEAYSYLTLACDMMQSGDACRELAEMLARGEIMPLRDERTRTVRWAAGRAKSVGGRVVSRCIQEHGVLDPGSGPYPRQITPTPEAKRCIEEKTKGTAGGLYAVGAILLGLPGPWDEILPESDDTSLLTANFPIEDSAKADWAKRVTANRRLMTTEDKRELMRLRGMARNDEEKAIALEMLNLASEKGVWEASRVLADLYARGEGVPRSPKEAARYRALAKKQKKSAGK